MVRLTVGELAALDPRPIKVILRDAATIADLAMRDLRSAAVNSDGDAAAIGRMLEAAKYTQAIGAAALAAGVEDEPPLPPGVEDVTAEIAPLLIEVADGVVGALGVDPVRARELRQWSRSALSIGLGQIAAGEPLRLPTAPEPVERASLPAAGGDLGSRAPAASPRPVPVSVHGDDDGEIVDAVLVDDDDQPLTAEEEADLVELEEAQRALAAKVAAGQRPGSGQIGGWNVGMEMRRVEAARAKVLTWAEEVDDEAGVSA